MMELQPEEITAKNDESLRTLARAIALSQGEFSLIFARCNYTNLRQSLMAKLRESSVKFRELVIEPSAKSLFTTIQEELGDEPPSAVIISGLELLFELNTVLISTNQLREEFRKNFRFPVVLWVTDEVLRKLIRVAPDFKSWAATPLGFEMPTDELIDFLQQHIDALFSGDIISDLEKCNEIEAAFQSLQIRGQELEPEMEAGLEFCRGLDDSANNQIDAAIEHYQKSLIFWQESQYLERKGILLLEIAFCYYRKAEQNRAESRQNWRGTRHYLQQCLEFFEQAQRPDLVARHINKLGEVLQRLQAWEDLQVLAQKALVLHQKYGDSSQVAVDYGFLAEVALAQSLWNEANQLAQQALQTLDKIPYIQPHERGLYRFLLARSQQHLGLVKEAVVNLEKARQETITQYNPELYINILGDLRLHYYQQDEYLKAFAIKQERISTEFQYNFRAFAGTSHLQPKQQVIHSVLQTGQEA
ncbi:MAG: tetratricopeptide repeat protein, partial [Cyanobacteriota bacterium]